MSHLYRMNSYKICLEEFRVDQPIEKKRNNQARYHFVLEF